MSSFIAPEALSPFLAFLYNWSSSSSSKGELDFSISLHMCLYVRSDACVHVCSHVCVQLPAHIYTHVCGSAEAGCWVLRCLCQLGLLSTFPESRNIGESKAYQICWSSQFVSASLHPQPILGLQVNWDASPALAEFWGSEPQVLNFGISISSLESSP